MILSVSPFSSLAAKDQVDVPKLLIPLYLKTKSKQVPWEARVAVHNTEIITVLHLHYARSPFESWIETLAPPIIRRSQSSLKKVTDVGHNSRILQKPKCCCYQNTLSQAHTRTSAHKRTYLHSQTLTSTKICPNIHTYIHQQRSQIPES